MPKILIVEKTGVITEKNAKNIQPAELYKVAGFKTADGFKCFTTWTPEVNGQKYTIQLFAKSVGKANNENKYEFPPPVDSTLFYGNCILVHSTETEIKDLSKSEWTVIYEYLYGGFEDIGNEDSEMSEDEYDDEIGENANLTKNGYVKDGFIVDDDEDDEDYEDEDGDEDDEDDNDDDEDGEEYIRPVNKTSNQKKKRAHTKSRPSSHAIVIDTSSTVELENYLDCTSELEYEEYV
jgi:hypothetical protein